MMKMMMIMTKVEKGSDENGWLGHDREKCKPTFFTIFDAVSHLGGSSNFTLMATKWSTNG
jgi:hypothetical protein